MIHAIAWLDRHGAATALPVLACLAVYLLFSALDDLALDLAWLLTRRRRRIPPRLDPGREKRIAILLPLWQEAAVIEKMLDHNLASIRYGNYEVLAGVYANDEETRSAVERAAARHEQVRVAVVPHDGPTSKADCLNWIFQRLVEQEMHGSPAAEVVLIHDAEDLIHPDSLTWINRLTETAGMVQVPVLALATPLGEMTHGVYCDDFAESQTKDLATRTALGAFLPGCGVGTAFRREELERLAEAESNRLFDPFALTEDYDNGLRLHELGCRQMFVPLQWIHGQPLATREYFPRDFRAAVRQRTRWVTGNCLQAWQRHGWGRGMPRRWLQAWFFWRDRKVLWGSWIGLLSNALFLWALAGWAAAKAAGAPWWLGESVSRHPWLGLMLTTNLALCVERLAVRMYCTGRIYGWLFAAAAPVRMVWGNLINAAASAGAVWQFARSLWTGQPLRWLKTEHCYPSLESLQPAEAIPGAWAAAAASAAAGPVAPPPVLEWRGSAPSPAAGLLRAMAPASPGMSGPELATRGAVDRRTLRALPAELCGQWLVAPLRVVEGCMEIASARPLSPAARREIARQAGMPVRFVDVSPDAIRWLFQQRDAVPCQLFLQRQARGARHAETLSGRRDGAACRQPDG